MSATPLVTVITVFLNAQKFLAEAITSLFAQRYSNWELVLVDDGSTDASTGLAKRYAREYPQKVRYLEHNGHMNCGISASQNLGIGVARGQYIAFLDSDDVWLPEKLEQQVSILDAHPEAIMVYGQTQYWYSWTGDSEDEKRDRLIQPGVEPDTLLMPPELLIRSLREEIPIPCPSDVMVRRQAAIEVGGFENSFRRIFTDQVFYAKLGLRGTVFVSGQNWFRYRKHAESAVAVVKERGKLRSARRAYLNWLDRYVNEHTITDPRVHSAIRTAKLRCEVPGLFRLQPHVRYRAMVVKERLKSILRRILPVALYRLLRMKPQSIAKPS